MFETNGYVFFTLEANECVCGCMHVLQLHAIYIHVYSLVAANFRLNNIVCFFMNRSTAQIYPNCVTYHVIYELKLLSTGLVLPLEKEKPTIYAKTLHAY